MKFWQKPGLFVTFSLHFSMKNFNFKEILENCFRKSEVHTIFIKNSFHIQVCTEHYSYLLLEMSETAGTKLKYLSESSVSVSQ